MGTKQTAARRAQASQIAMRHGHSVGSQGGRTPTYCSWQNMIARCRYPSVPSYRNYGGRGIAVCERWNSFENFLADMGERPDWATGGIDRIDPDGNYVPGNCRWATKAQQTPLRGSNGRYTR